MSSSGPDKSGTKSIHDLVEDYYAQLDREYEELQRALQIDTVSEKIIRAKLEEMYGPGIERIGTEPDPHSRPADNRDIFDPIDFPDDDSILRIENVMEVSPDDENEIREGEVFTEDLELNGLELDEGNTDGGEEKLS